MQRTYELMFIVRPDMPEEEQDKLISTVETQVGNAGGTVRKEGMKRMLIMAVALQPVAPGRRILEFALYAVDLVANAEAFIP